MRRNIPIFCFSTRTKEWGLAKKWKRTNDLWRDSPRSHAPLRRVRLWVNFLWKLEGLSYEFVNIADLARFQWCNWYRLFNLSKATISEYHSIKIMDLYLKETRVKTAKIRLQVNALASGSPGTNPNWCP